MYQQQQMQQRPQQVIVQQQAPVHHTTHVIHQNDGPDYGGGMGMGFLGGMMLAGAMDHGDEGWGGDDGGWGGDDGGWD